MIPNVDVVRFIKKERLPHRALVETDFRTPTNRSTRINTILIDIIPSCGEMEPNKVVYCSLVSIYLFIRV